MNILLAAGLLLNMAGLAVLIYSLYAIRRKAQQFEDSIRSFISAPDDKTPSPFAQTVDAIGQTIARAVIVQAKTTLLGMNSGAVRAEQAEVKQATLAKFPWLGALATFAPGISKSLMKNPALLNLAQGALSRGAVGATAPGGLAGATAPATAPHPPGANGRREPVRFEL